MTLIQIKTKQILSIPHLFRSILKFIYEPEKMSLLEEKEMMDSFNSWKNAIDLEKEKLLAFQAQDLKTFGLIDHRITPNMHKYSEEEYHLTQFAILLDENAQGLYDQRKINFKEKGVDYRKFHRLPEAYVPQDFIDGQKAGEEHDKRFPEFYGEKLN